MVLFWALCHINKEQKTKKQVTVVIYVGSFRNKRNKFCSDVYNLQERHIIKLVNGI